MARKQHVVSVRAESAEIAAWKKAAEQASKRAGAVITLVQWIRGRLNEAAKKEAKK